MKKKKMTVDAVEFSVFGFRISWSSVLRLSVKLLSVKILLPVG
jgi:hypothetical protein